MCQRLLDSDDHAEVETLWEQDLSCAACKQPLDMVDRTVCACCHRDFCEECVILCTTCQDPCCANCRTDAERCETCVSILGVSP